MRQVQGKEVGLPLDPADHQRGFAKIRLGIALAATLLHEQVASLMLVVTVGVVACVVGAKKYAH